MIFKILKLIIFILLIWYLSEFFANSEGETSVNWMGWGIQIPTDRFVLILILFSILIIFIDRIWLAFLNFPKAAFRRYEVNNNKKVEQKLVKAFLLASHGEFESAAKEASLVAKNTKDKNFKNIENELIMEAKNIIEKLLAKKDLESFSNEELNLIEQSYFEKIKNYLAGFFMLRQYSNDQSPRGLITKAELELKSGNLYNFLSLIKKLPDNWKVPIKDFIFKLEKFLLSIDKKSG